MSPRHVMLASLLLLPLAGCGTNDDEDQLPGLEASVAKMGQCITVHAAVLASSMNPLTVAMNGEGTDEIVSGMHELKGNLPTDSTGQTSPREAFVSIIGQIEGIRGGGMDAAERLSKSAAYHADAAVLTGWYTAHCAKDGKKPAG